MKMNIKTVAGLAAVAGFLAVAAPSQPANAVSLLNPGASTAAKHASEGLTTEVRWGRRHGGWHRHGGWRRHHWRHRRW